MNVCVCVCVLCVCVCVCVCVWLGLMRVCVWVWACTHARKSTHTSRLRAQQETPAVHACVGVFELVCAVCSGGVWISLVGLRFAVWRPVPGAQQAAAGKPTTAATGQLHAYHTHAKRTPRKDRAGRVAVPVHLTRHVRNRRQVIQSVLLRTRPRRRWRGRGGT